MLKRNEDSIDITTDYNGRTYTMKGELSYGIPIFFAALFCLVIIITEPKIQVALVALTLLIIAIIIYIILLKHNKKKNETQTDKETINEEAGKIITVNKDNMIIYKRNNNISIELNSIKEVLINSGMDVVVFHYHSVTKELMQEKFTIQMSNKNLIEMALKEYKPDIVVKQYDLVPYKFLRLIKEEMKKG